MHRLRPRREIARPWLEIMVRSIWSSLHIAPKTGIPNNNPPDFH